MAGSQDSRDGLYHLLFGVRVSRRYHDHRERWYNCIHTSGQIAVIVFGGTSFAALSAPASISKWVAFTVLVLGAISWTISPVEKAAKHREIRRRFIDLEIQCEKAYRAKTSDEDKYQHLYADRLSIERDEPPVLRNLNIICRDAQCRAEGSYKHVSNIAWWQRLFAPVVDICPDRIKPLDVDQDASTKSN